MEHPKIRALFDKVQREEIVPHVAPVPGMTPDAYVDLIATRFANPRIVDTTRRVAFDGSSRHPGFVIPSILDGLAAGTPIEGLALVEASWARMCAGTREDGSAIEPNDPNWDRLNTHALKAHAEPRVWLSMKQIYGTLADAPRFADAFDRWLRMIWDKGLERAINSYLEGS